MRIGNTVISEKGEIMNRSNLKEKIKQQVTDYLKANDIEYNFLIRKESELEITDSASDIIYFTLPAIEAISKDVNIILNFEEESCYCQGFFSRPIMNDKDTEEEINKMCRLINHVNSNFSASIYNSVMMLNEYDGKVYIGTLLKYELFESFFEYTIEYILEGRDMLCISCYPLLAYKTGRMTFEQAVDHINNAIGGE